MNTHISPMLSVRSGKNAIEFYKSAFDAEVLFCVEGESDTVVAELSINGASFWVADESPQHENFSPESLAGSTCRIILVVENPEVVFNRAIEAKARIIWPVQEQHGWLIGRVCDPYGHHWEIGRKL